MSNFYSNLVFLEVEEKEAPRLAEKVISFLLERGIIDKDQKDNILSDSPGYPPGSNYKQIVNDSSQNLLELLTNGVDVHIGKRVYYFDHLYRILCPMCNGDVIQSNWSDAISEWIDGSGFAKIECPNCNSKNHLLDLNFDPKWRFSALGLTFWNWGMEFNQKFIAELEQLSAKKIGLTYGKL